MKKNKDIEVAINESTVEVAGKTETLFTLTIAKKEIGKVYVEEKHAKVVFPDDTTLTVKNPEEGFEAVIRQWNLQQ